jgi:REP element-mobilizing transposase RayT
MSWNPPPKKSGHFKRKTIRLKDYNYAQPGAYFITINVLDRKCLFGSIKNKEMVFNRYGRIAQDCWHIIPQHFIHADVDAFIVMPNHFHGIVIIKEVAARHASPLHQSFRGSKAPTLGTIVGSYKSAVTKQINKVRKTSGLNIWQSNYYEHIIRNETELDKIRQYILTNPLNWKKDIHYMGD